MRSADFVVCRTLTRRCVGARLIHDFEARGRAGIEWRELAGSTLIQKCRLLRASRHEAPRLKRPWSNPINVSASSAVRKRLRRAWLSSVLRLWPQTEQSRPGAVSENDSIWYSVHAHPDRDQCRPKPRQSHAAVERCWHPDRARLLPRLYPAHHHDERFLDVENFIVEPFRLLFQHCVEMSQALLGHADE